MTHIPFPTPDGEPDERIDQALKEIFAFLTETIQSDVPLDQEEFLEHLDAILAGADVDETSNTDNHPDDA